MPLLRKKRWDVFVSHAHTDATDAKAIAAALVERGLSCWFDQDQLRVGNLYDERIQRAIADSRTVLVLVSRAATASDYVKHEISSALAQKIPIAPAFLEEVPRELLKAPLDFSEVRLHAVNLAGERRAAALPRLGEELLLISRSEKRRWMLRSFAAGAASTALIAGIAVLGFMAARAPALADIVKGDVVFAPPADAGNSATPAETTLDFRIYGLRRGAESWSALANGDSLASGENYCVRAAPHSRGYLYIFQRDSAGKVEWIFPKNETSRFSHGANPVDAGQEIFLPPENDRAYVLDDVAGPETFYAYLCNAPWPQLEASLRRAATGGGGVPAPRPPGADHREKPLLGAKGIAREISTGVARTATRSSGGGPMRTMSVAPTAFNATGPWISVEWTIQHVPAPVVAP